MVAISSVNVAGSGLPIVSHEVCGCGVPSGNGICVIDGTTNFTRVKPRSKWVNIAEVYRCRCNTVGCPDCDWILARMKAENMHDDCRRLGITSLSTWCVTIDASRFDDPFHLSKKNVVFHLMNYFWSTMPKKYRKDWGEEPLWWAYKEIQDGKRSEHGKGTGNLHVHVYFPSPNKTGRIPRVVWDGTRDLGIELSGRTTYGWKKQGIFSAPVEDCKGYATKMMAYANKGIEGVSDAIADSKSFKPMTRSRGVSWGDPKCIESRDKRAEKQKAIAGLDVRIREAGRERDYYKQRALKRARDLLVNGPKVKRVLRTNRERAALCGLSVVVRDDNGNYRDVNESYKAIQGAAQSVLGYSLAKDRGALLIPGDGLNRVLSYLREQREPQYRLWPESPTCPVLAEQRASATVESKQSVPKMLTVGLGNNQGDRQPVKLQGKSGEFIFCLTERSGCHSKSITGQVGKQLVSSGRTRAGGGVVPRHGGGPPGPAPRSGVIFINSHSSIINYLRGPP